MSRHVQFHRVCAAHLAHTDYTHLAGREVQVAWGALRVTEGGTRRLIRGLVKLMQFCVSFIAL